MSEMKSSFSKPQMKPACALSGLYHDSDSLELNIVPKRVLPGLSKTFSEEAIFDLNPAQHYGTRIVSRSKSQVQKPPFEAKTLHGSFQITTLSLVHPPTHSIACSRCKIPNAFLFVGYHADIFIAWPSTMRGWAFR
jgi:hypothetical protein